MFGRRTLQDRSTAGEAHFDGYTNSNEELHIPLGLMEIDGELFFLMMPTGITRQDLEERARRRKRPEPVVTEKRCPLTGAPCPGDARCDTIQRMFGGR